MSAAFGNTWSMRAVLDCNTIACNAEQEALAVQVNVESMPPGEDNPYGIGFFHSELELTSELQAVRDVDPTASRVWKIKNPAVTNPMSGDLPPAVCGSVRSHCLTVLGCMLCAESWGLAVSAVQKAP